jgi:hypothetical protein
MMCWLVNVGGLLSLLAGGATAPAVGPAQTNNQAVASAPSRPTGGLQLALEPRRAQVFVDGAFVGLVDDFTGYYHPLELPAGRHYMEVLSPGYLPMIWDVIVVPGRTLTYRMSLQEASRSW